MGGAPSAQLKNQRCGSEFVFRAAARQSDQLTILVDGQKTRKQA